ncbi:hypothetical protein [Marinimicrobium koreense]|uniref:hypothetical protein n=1 Tax=Marinimicrobium koreense TaxID=306545 RepID=UPI003F72AD0A
MIGVKPHVLRSVISGYLVRRGYLAKYVEPVPHLPGQASRGRPKYHYKYTEGFDGSFEKEVVLGATDYHKDLVETLMNTRCSEELGPEETLLLAVLLRFADMSGTVRTLGLSALKGLIGASRSKVLAMLESLQANKLLLARSPGGTSPSLFGKVKSLYILDLKSLYVRMNIDESSQLYRVRMYAVRYSDSDIVSMTLGLFREVERLTRINTKIRRLASEEPSDLVSGRKWVRRASVNDQKIRLLELKLCGILDIDLDKSPVCNPLKQSASKTSVDLLRRKVSDYACALLLEGKDTQGGFVREDYELIRERIEADIENVETQGDKTKEKVANFIYWASVKEAEVISALAIRIDPATGKPEKQDGTLTSRFDAITVLPNCGKDDYKRVIVATRK